jgi:hypothetical protein
MGLVMPTIWLGNEQAQALLDSELPANGRPVQELRAIAEDRGVGWRTVERTAQKMGVRRRRVGFGPGSTVMWYPPIAP